MKDPNCGWVTGARVLSGLVALLLLKVTGSIVAGYGGYFPPSFDAEFLQGREAYFFGAYGVAFYAHVVAGPITLLVGLFLIAEPLRSRFPTAHRRLGKFQAALVLLVLAPSGLWMAFYAEPIAAGGFASLALGAGASVALGWRAAVQRRMAEHRRWMWRCYLLLCSAVVLRLIGGMAAVTGVGAAWSYPLAAWVSWLGPLTVFEWLNWRPAVRWKPRPSASGVHLSPAAPSASRVVSSSPPAVEISARR